MTVRGALIGMLVPLAGLVPPGRPAVPLPCWQAPVRAEVADPFRPPPCTWCPGNRGLEYRVQVGQPVRSVAGGRVAFAGVVAGQRFVAVEVDASLRVTYGRLAISNVSGGDFVTRGQLLGFTGPSFILTVRASGRYVDPAPLIGRPRSRPHLVPTDGTPGRRAPPATTSCSGGG